MELTVDEQRRMGDIVVMKRRATGLLVVATLIFIAARVAASDDSGVWGYVRATAEAAMVGGLADWFAVTALFRHPLGLPIPHTAILPQRKDQLGETFGSFIRQSFLAPDVLTERLEEAQIPRRLAAWLSAPENAATAAGYAGSVAATVAQLLDDEEVADLLAAEFADRLHQIDMAPLVGRAVEIATEDGRHHRLVDAALDGAAEMMAAQRATLRARFAAESPWWVPEVVDERMFARLYAGLETFINEVRTDPDHPLRAHVDRRLVTIVEELKTDPRRARRVAEIRDELLEHPAVVEWSRLIWARLRERLVESAAEPDSRLRSRLAEGVNALGHALSNDPELDRRVERTIIDVAATLAERYGDEIADFVRSTVERWDATETSTRVELLLGRDLQIIRINGSVVGGLAGLAIHTVSEIVVQR